MGVNSTAISITVAAAQTLHRRDTSALLTQSLRGSSAKIVR